VTPFIELAASYARAERKRSPILRNPSFGESKGEHEHIKFFDCSPDRSKMLLPAGLKFESRTKTIRLNLWSKWVDKPTINRYPDIFDGVKKPIGAFQQLNKLTRSVDIPVSGGVYAIAKFLRKKGRHDRMSRLGHKVTKSAFAQMARNMLRKAASCCDDTIGWSDVELCVDNGINVGNFNLHE
jgi:hypothetical protein